MSSRQYLIDAATKHQIFIRRYAGTINKEMLRFIKILITTLQTQLKTANTEFARGHLNQYLQELTILQKTIYDSLALSAKQQLLALAKYEAQFNKRIFDAATKNTFSTLPTLEQLKIAAFSTMFNVTPGFKASKQMSVEQALNQFGTKKAAEIVQQVRVGFALGQTEKEITKNIVDIMTTKVPREAQALARTMTNHVSAESRLEFYDQNKQYIEAYQVVATLDDRTTLECAALDGKVFDVDEFEEPPYHWGCRTTFISVIKGEYDKGSIVDGGRPALDPSKEGRKYEEVSSQTTYNSWLRRQSDEFQNEVLGPNRAELFRGGMNLDKFVDSNYKPLTLNQLRSLDNTYT